MSVQREIQAGPLVAAAGGVVLVVGLFFDWFEEFSGWTVFEALDLVLAGLGLGAILAAAAAIGLPAWVPVRALPAIGATAFVVVGSQLLNHPPVGIDEDLQSGAWLALAGAALMLAGGVISVARVSVALNVSERPAQPPPPPPPADDPTRPLSE